MDVTFYDVIFIITNLFDTYIIYLFITCFFDERVTGKTTETMSYLSYFVLMALLYWFIDTPIFYLIFNLIAFILISYNYKGSFKKRVISSVLIYGILFCVEILTISMLTGITRFAIFETNVTLPVLSLLSIKIFSFIVALIIKNFKNIKRGGEICMSNWISILVMPLGSLATMLIVVSAHGIKYEYMVLIVGALLLMNFTAFYLFDAITKASEEKLEYTVLQEKNRYYGAHLHLMNSSFEALRIFKHDINNHLAVLETTLNYGDEEQISGYVKALKSACQEKQDFVNTKNMTIDSIINFKLNNTQDLVKRVNVSIPENIKVDPYDMICILGNLLDNAIRGASESEDKLIDITLKYDKEKLFIRVENSYSEELIEQAGRLKTSKFDKENHGMGLDSVRKSVEKNDGTLDINFDKNKFSVLVIL